MSESTELILSDTEIIRPLSNYEYYTQKSRTQKGLVTCHGTSHRIKTMSKIKCIELWYSIDKNKECYPDYVCKIDDKNGMEYIPTEYFDLILSEHCPLIKINLQDMFDNYYRILKDDGYLVFSELPFLFFWFINEHQMSYIIDKIHQIINDATFIDIINQLYKIRPNYKILLKKQNSKTTNMLISKLYQNIICKNFKYPQKDIFVKFILDYSMKCT